MAMIAGPVSHLLRHIFVSYHKHGRHLKERLLLREKLAAMEQACIRMQQKGVDGKEVGVILMRIREVKKRLG